MLLSGHIACLPRGWKWRERKAAAQTGKTFDITEAKEEKEANARFALRLFGEEGVQWILISVTPIAP